MFNAHVRDGAAMCDVLSYLEEKFIMLGDHYTEIKLSREIDLTRRSQKLSHDISFETGMNKLEARTNISELKYLPFSGCVRGTWSIGILRAQ